MGAAGESAGLEIAARLGLEAEVIDLARRRLEPGERLRIVYGAGPPGAESIGGGSVVTVASPGVSLRFISTKRS